MNEKTLGEDDDDYLEQIEVDAEDEADEEDAAKEAEERRKKGAPAEEPPFAHAREEAMSMRVKADLAAMAGTATPASPPPTPKRPRPLRGKEATAAQAWHAVAQYAGPRGADLDHMMDDALGVGDYAVWRRVGFLYQDYLYVLARCLHARVIVETGVLNGVSTRFLLQALRDDVDLTDPDDRGVLLSCDPLPLLMSGLGEAGVLGDPMLTLRNVRSVDAFPEFAALAPSWDMFVHDSDHRLENQTFELEFAWHMVREGGLIVCDDHDATHEGTKAGSQHGAWPRFALEHGLDWKVAGTAAFAERPAGPRLPPAEALKHAAEVAVAAVKRYNPTAVAMYAGLAK